MIVIGIILVDGKRVLVPIMNDGDDWWQDLLADSNVDEIESVHYVPEDVPFIMNGVRWK